MYRFGKNFRDTILSAEYRKFRNSLLRRFSVLDSTKSKRQGNGFEDAFSARYLNSFNSPKEEAFDVALTKVALKISRYDGQDGLVPF